MADIDAENPTPVDKVEELQQSAENVSNGQAENYDGIGSDHETYYAGVDIEGEEYKELVRPAPYADRKPIGNYEYLDHPADVQLHSWGDSLKESFEQVALAMFDYMTDVTLVEKETTESITVEGDDLNSLLFHFLDEWLFLFSADPFFIPREVIIDEFDEKNFKIVCRGIGEAFDLCKHPQGTEVKAITYSNMQVHDKDPKHDIFVIIDI